MKITTSFRKHAAAAKAPKPRIVVSQGGTSSAKTWSILQILLIILIKRQNKGVLISVVSETLPHLKKGAMRDFFLILESEGIYDVKHHNKSDHTYTIGKSVIEFFSVDQPHKVRGPRRDILFINECNNVPYETFEQLEIRTREQIWLDFNPVQQFWVHEEVMKFMDYMFIQTTYLDNEELPDEIVASIELRKGRDVNWWNVYGKGELGKLEGLVFPTIYLVDTIPQHLDNWYGQDFGYTNDPSVLINIATEGSHDFSKALHPKRSEKESAEHVNAPDKLYLDEMMYRKGLTNKDISDLYGSYNMTKRYDQIYADSAEPKTIDEIFSYGWNIYPARKGKDSIVNGIDVMKRFDICVTKRSINLIKEFRNYLWVVDKHGNITNKPIDAFNHGMDASRYGVTMKIQRPPFTPPTVSVPRVGR